MGDMELLHVLSTRSKTLPSGEVEDSEPHPTPPGPHANHHKHDKRVHPIVEHLRNTCNDEFQQGICGFALANRVCPRKLLKCLVANRDKLSEPCKMQTQVEVVRVVEAENNDPVMQFLGLCTWLLMLLACVMCCSWCCKALCRCCCGSAGVDSELVEAEDAQLEMALVISAMDTGKGSDAK